MASKKEHRRRQKVRGGLDGDKRPWHSGPPRREVNSLDILLDASISGDFPGRSQKAGGNDVARASLSDPWLLEDADSRAIEAEAAGRACRLAEEAERARRQTEDAGLGRRREAEGQTVKIRDDVEREDGRCGEERREGTENPAGIVEAAPVSPAGEGGGDETGTLRPGNPESIEPEAADSVKGDPIWWERPDTVANAIFPAVRGDLRLSEKNGSGERVLADEHDAAFPVTMDGTHTNVSSDLAVPDGAERRIPPEPREGKMYIVMITPEVAPCAKVGGLGDVVLGLGRELTRRGHEVEAICPMYSCIRYEEVKELREEYGELWCPHGRDWRQEKVYQGRVGGGLKVSFITGGSYTERNSIYGHPDDLDRFAYFSRQSLEFLFKSG
ncbi:MAG: glycogen/starch synthase, partial [Planctomycetota bacterium]|nr:glycogen/starch synthase [Planctomycetota bacterium]